ncbi:capping protein, Arp2/3 and myosin-I linker protein 2 isoform X2 [Narcine bancroftii]|uniref:capping protein, Arp2/3 and myosin-I linker protein 2 isoform X2 n=1 Tax=Narcine bancroftii TaxID=1343680 RepID=UPI003831270F
MDVDTIYHSQNTKEFNLLDFSHLDTRDLALSVAALAFNPWFTKLFSKDLRLSPDVIEQVLYVISLSTKLEELVLENAGIKFDTAQKIAQALEENVNPALNTINLSNNQLEDRGVSALSLQFEKLTKGMKSINISRTSLASKGLNSLAQSFIANESFAHSLVHLDLSGNPGILAVEENCNFYTFLARPNILAHLDLAGTDCALDSLFGALSHGCCTHLTSLILNRNVISQKKGKEIHSSMRQFFSNCLSLKTIVLSGIKLPLEAVRAILQGLAYNTHISDVFLDLSSCELRSAGAQVIQDHIIDANSISSLDLSDNGFDSDMVTLVLSIGRSKSIRQVALGKNFNMKSKALADVLHRIVQLIQDEDCPLQSLSVADSRLKSGTSVLINALGSNTCLKEIDISGNAMGDNGTKMLAKALQINTTLRTLIWDRNNTTIVGFLDVARALERNYTLKSMHLPMSDMSQACRSHPEKTEEALQKIQSCLLRNNQMEKVSPEQAFRLQERIITSSTQQMVDSMCEKVQEYLHIINNGSMKERQDVIFAEEIIKDAKTLTTLLPALYQMGNRPPLVRTVQAKLESAAADVSQAIVKEIQTLTESLVKSTSMLCPSLLQKVNMQEHLIDKISDKLFNPKNFARSMIIDQTGSGIMNKLSEVKLHVTAALISHIVDCVLKDLAIAQQKLACYATKPQCETSDSNTSVENSKEEAIRNIFTDSSNIPDELAPIESLSLLRRKTIHSRRIRPTTASKSNMDEDLERQVEEQADTTEQLTVSPQSIKPCPSSTEVCGINSTNAESVSMDCLINLPTEGMKLQHHTRGRPRPNRTRKQPPSKPSVKSADQDNRENTTNGKLDDGLEVFFKKTECKETRKAQPVKQEELNISTSIPTKTKKRYPKFSDLFLFKKAKINKMQKEEKDPEGTSQKGKKGSSLDFWKMQSKSEETQDQAKKPQEGDAEPDKQENVSRQQPSPRGVKANSLILLPGYKDGSNLSVHGLELNSGVYEGKILFRSDEHINWALDKPSLNIIPSDLPRSPSTQSELKVTACQGVSGENKPLPPPQSFKRLFQVNVAKSCTSITKDKEQNLKKQLFSESKNGEVDGEETKRQEKTSGRDQKILLPPPRTKYLQQQTTNPVPVPRKFNTLQDCPEAPGTEKYATSDSTSIKIPNIAGKEKSGNCPTTEDKNEIYTVELLPQEISECPGEMATGNLHDHC